MQMMPSEAFVGEPVLVVREMSDEEAYLMEERMPFLDKEVARFDVFQ